MASTSEPMHTKGAAVAEGMDSNESSAVAAAVDLSVSSAVAIQESRMAWDGKAYTKEEFQQWYGAAGGNIWDTAVRKLRKRGQGFPPPKVYNPVIPISQFGDKACGRKHERCNECGKACIQEWSTACYLHLNAVFTSERVCCSEVCMHEYLKGKCGEGLYMEWPHPYVDCLSGPSSLLHKNAAPC